MKTFPISVIAFPVALLLALAPAAVAEDAPLLPPGNSAVNQYTEAFPTAAGDRDAHENDSLRSPRQVLGKKRTGELRSRGADGNAVAELTAETAPGTEDVVILEEDGEDDSAGIGAAGSGGGGGEAEGARGDDQSRSGSGSKVVFVEAGDGPSSLGEVIGRAAGISPSGGLGIFLPLIIIATVGWAAGYAARHRRPTA